MIVVDTSAFVCILRGEADFDSHVRTLRSAHLRSMSAGTYLECVMIAASRLGGREAADRWLRAEAIHIRAVDHAQAEIAADAFVRFGKGRHPAGLNYGDCFAYALAKSLNAPLLFKSEHFSLTDLVPALTS